MPYDINKVAPTYLPFASNITYSVSGSTVTNTYVLTAGLGSAFGAINGYVLNNDVSNTSATISLLSGGTLLTRFRVAAGQYRTIFVVGADTITVRASTASSAVTGELNLVINANPM